MRKLGWVALAAGTGLVFFAACVGDEPGSSVDSTSDASSDDAPSTTDGGTGDGNTNDAAPLPCPADLAIGASRCGGNELDTCEASGLVKTTCGFGCSMTDGGVAQCGEPNAIGVILQIPDYRTATATASFTSQVPYYANTDTGVIETRDGNGTASPVRGSGPLSAGIAFYTASQGPGKPTLGVFAFRGLNIAQGVVLQFEGNNTAGLVVTQDLGVAGTISVRSDCAANQARAGAGVGGDPSQPGAGPHGGAQGSISGQFSPGNAAGGGGGGNGSIGGVGGTAPFNAAGGTTAGLLLGDGGFLLAGGSGGGGGGKISGTPTTGRGGAAAGAIDLVVFGTLSLDGAIDARGCGGLGARGNAVPASTEGIVGGGGGGSGGTVVVEAASIHMGPLGHIVAGGGGGGGPSDATTTPASPGTPPSLDGVLGAGGAGSGPTCGTRKGGHGSNDASDGGAAGADCFTPATGGMSGGGGGGGSGRVAIRAVSPAAFVRDPAATIYPAPELGLVKAR